MLELIDGRAPRVARAPIAAVDRLAASPLDLRALPPRVKSDEVFAEITLRPRVRRARELVVAAKAEHRRRARAARRRRTRRRRRPPRPPSPRRHRGASHHRRGAWSFYEGGCGKEGSEDHLGERDVARKALVYAVYRCSWINRRWTFDVAPGPLAAGISRRASPRDPTRRLRRPRRPARRPPPPPPAPSPARAPPPPRLHVKVRGRVRALPQRADERGVAGADGNVARAALRGPPRHHRGEVHRRHLGPPRSSRSQHPPERLREDHLAEHPADPGRRGPVRRTPSSTSGATSRAPTPTRGASRATSCARSAATTSSR